ncbi:hypothetical protein CHS0354_007509 [Potamilus streckersoni]|uniref:Fatty acid synthase n=1 Tax=Potamilus streckersoni TaxID=2493646 RepID=A0AAE0T7U4_9BIVA|nr:hypothetical protein CHS0354_007509 [Potamilus streckersoni]
MCPHRGAVFSYHSRHVLYPYTDTDREACNVFYVWEMLRPLMKGIPMYVIPNTVIYDPPLLCEYLRVNQITRMLFTPSLLEAVLNTSGLDFERDLKTLRCIIFCGEVVTTALFDKCLKVLPWIQFLNLYSVSECHDVAIEDLNDYFNKNKDALKTRKFCPVGKIIPGCKVVILDEFFNVQPVGASGEIYVGGPTLARGYLNRPEVQAKRFIPRPESLPASFGDRLYRSGDWGYMLSDKSLEICGRCDSMVKIRGYSIETQAVEAALMSLPMVHACVVLVKGEEGQDKFLVAYIVPEGQTTKKKIREALKLRLPFYMIPSYFVFLSSIPVVPASGKLDKTALPPFERQSGEEEEAMEGKAGTETEKALAQIWREILQIKDIDIMESFFDLGGHSLMATELTNQIRQKFGVNVAVKDLFTYPTISSLAQVIDAANQALDSDGSGSVRVVPVIKPTLNLEDEIKKHDQGILNMDMQLRAFWRTFSFYKNRFTKGRIFLTGATGFLGAFILRELILKTKTYIVCVIRVLPDTTPLERLKQTLQQFGIIASEGSEQTDEQAIVEKELSTRTVPVQGDVALVNLGMTEEEYTYLTTDIDFIIHAAASVNMVYPYSALHGPNVMGTANILLFACSGKIKPVHHISTDAVFPHGMKDCSEDDECLDYHTKLMDGYSQSKWVAEQLVRQAGKRGLPITIYRLGNMAGDSKNAYWNPADFTLLMLKVCAELKMAPDVDWDMEMTPVDFAAEFIIQMIKNPTLSLGKTFHIVNDKPLKARLVFEWMNANGYPVQIVSYDEWTNRVCEVYEGQQLHKLVENYVGGPSFFTSMSTYQTDQLKQTLKSLQMEYPYTDRIMINNYFTNLAKHNVITKQISYVGAGKKLEGKVAIVTGASSGIGWSIATILADVGAKVAMAARRIDRLQELGVELSRRGGAVICVQTDVTKKEEVKELVSHTEMALGPVDILVNNAGCMYYTLMSNLHEDEWEHQIDVNIKGLTNCIGAVLDGMLSRKSGHIVNMSSNAGRKGFPGLAVYSGTKFYVEGLSQALRQEVCGSGVKVTCIQPGDVRTELLSHSTDTEALKLFDGSGKTQILDPEDIAKAVLYAVTQPDYCAINEILIEPKEAPV